MHAESLGTTQFAPPSARDVESNFVSVLLTSSTIALGLYDYFLTLPREVTSFWKQRLTVSSWFFFVNRYATIICSLLLAVRLVNWSPELQPPYVAADNICDTAARITDSCKVIMHIVFALFASIRTYAIWQKNRTVLLSVLLPGLVYPAGYVYYTIETTSSAAPPPLIGCYEHAGSTPTASLALLGVSSTVFFECIAIVLTWVKTIPTVRRAKRTERWHKNFIPLTYVVFYDGTLLFIVIVVSNCAGLLAMTSPSLTVLFTFSDVLGSVLTSRFLLDLREDYISNSPNQCLDNSFHMSDMSSVKFNPCIFPDSSNSSALQTMSAI